MKIKTLLIVGICALMCAAKLEAQPVLATHMENKKISQDYLETAHYLGEYQGLCCWVGDKKKEQKQVMLVDQNLQVIREFTFRTEEDYDLLAATLDGNNASLLMADRSSRKQTLVYSALVDLDSMRLVDNVIVMRDSLTYNRKDVCHLWAAVSPNGKRVAQVSIVEYPDKKEYTATIRLMDGKLTTLWERQYAMETMSEMCVADDGTIATLGYEELEGETVFHFNVLNEGESYSCSTPTKCDPLREMHLAGVVDGYAIGVGTFRPKKSDPDDDICGGVVALSFNTRSHKLAGCTVRPFMNEDINILLNKKTKKVQKDLMAQLISLTGHTTTSYGVVMAAGRNYMRTVTENNGSLSNSYIRMGLHLVSVDTAANVKWVRNLRRNDVQDGGDNLVKVSLFGMGDKVMVMKSESPKMPAIYDIANEAKEFEVGSKNNIVLYSIDAEGEVSKTIVEQKTKHTLVRTELRNDGTIMLLSENGSRTRLADLTLE